MIKLTVESITGQPTSYTAPETANIEIEGQGRQPINTVIVGDRIRRVPIQQFAEVLSVESV